MSGAARLFIGLVALLHIGFAVLEIFYFQHPIGLRVFKVSAELAEQSWVMMFNQGFYNLFLVAALLLSLGMKNLQTARSFAWFGLSCVVVAGVVGALTVSKNVFFIQALPAIVGAVLLYKSSGAGARE